MLLLTAASLAQTQKEVRGIWLTTLSGLDWPSPSLQGNAAAQQQALLGILDDLQRRNFNTVFFQVRSRGNTMYYSTLEPWASELTGTLGADPGWDPLAFAIAACHERGMELHAWFNVTRVWTSGNPPSSSPAHVARAHPSWVKRYEQHLWLDPGIPAAREYTVQVAEELARRYDIDGLHLDYCRYPERAFNDADSWKQYGTGGNRDQWRRENINAIVREVYRRCTGIRPTLQVGSAPIGIYVSLPTAKGWEGRNAVYQDSRAWLAGGYHDYVVPQIYWGLRGKGSTIDFEALVADWASHASGRHVYAGIAAYKDHVQRWLPEMIDASRAEQALGQVFFRYEHIRSEDLGHRYYQAVLPPPLTWRDTTPPNPPMNFSVTADGGTANISWQPPSAAEDGDVARRYAVYRTLEGSSNAGGELLAVLPASRLSYSDSSPRQGATYVVTALDAFRNESAAAGTQPILAARPVLAPPGMPAAGPALSPPVASGEDLLLIGYGVARRGPVRLFLAREDGSEVRVLVDAMQGAGTYVVGIERERLPEDVTACILESGSTRNSLPFLVPDN